MFPILHTHLFSWTASQRGVLPTTGSANDSRFLVGQKDVYKGRPVTTVQDTLQQLGLTDIPDIGWQIDVSLVCQGP